MLRDTLIQKGLSNREAEVGELVSKGLSNKEVANQLFVTEKTVKFHLTNIYKKMSVKSRAQLIVWCLPHLGYIEAENRVENNAAIQTQNVSSQFNVQATQTIPAGNSTVAAPTLPASPSQLNRNSGNSDIGAMGI
ncbi:MAG: helix-turn-helix transcriptional regulator [Deltaproteobacteria bacterium]|jgi:DNA-binding CsgD family transcriptional regulator|nr:helix-turn-helix transcriptional regulator [Deltaproteobacteria bacterium]